MLGVENGVNGGEADIFVAAPVAGDEVLGEQFVVVGCFVALEIEWDAIANRVVRIGLDDADAWRGRVSVRIKYRAGHRIVGDVVEERVARANCRDNIG